MSKVRADQGLKEVRDLYRALNAQLNEWAAEGMTSNDVRLFEGMLSDFYDKYDLSVKNKARFTWQKNMTQDQVDELFQIAQQMADDPYTDLETYKEMEEEGWEDIGTQNTYDKINLDAFQKINDQLGGYIDDLQDYVDFIDNMNNFKSNALLSSILESNQVAELYALGSWQALDESEVNRLIAMEYNATGKTGDRLYETIWEAIDLLH